MTAAGRLHQVQADCLAYVQGSAGQGKEFKPELSAPNIKKSFHALNLG
jgi:hypothetical protein